ncbi:MAG: UDP-N-acetylmuramoyl-L-alanine--D-glutamate ligase [Ignavibacteria bacterium]
MADIKNSSFTVLGAGRSGIAIAKLLKYNGAEVFLSDEHEREELKYFDEQIFIDGGIKYELGKHSDKVYESDVVIKSPGIAPENEVILKSKQLGKKIYSEIEAAYWFCKAPVIAITGTNGKTTTSVLTGEIFKNAGFDVKVCGNVGLAFSEVIPFLKEESIVVLEVSSYQLNDIKDFRPAVSVIMNITPDHIDWHGSFENYMNAKLNILKNQSETDITIINYDDDRLKKAVKDIKPEKAFFSIEKNLTESDVKRGSFIKDDKIIYFDKEKSIEEEIMLVKDINIRGKHNLYNSLAAIISARAFEIRNEVLRNTLISFPGVEHRIEFVKVLHGISFYNDSKATNIDSLIVALESFEKDLILIMGGREKGNDYTVIDKLISERVKVIIAIGETKDKISKHFEKIKKVISADSMEDAVIKAIESGKAGDTVLLSPACKSFDMFENFEHRGEEFKKAVNRLR